MFHFQVGKVDTHKLRATLDVTLKNPTLLLPHHFTSSDLLIIQLGKLSVGNSFVCATATSIQQDPTVASSSSMSTIGRILQFESSESLPQATSAGAFVQQEWNCICIDLSEVQVKR